MGPAVVVASLLAVVPTLGSVNEPDRFGPHDIPTLFSIGKNLDKNEVHFGLRLDAQCNPIGDAPVFAYWRQYEQGPEITEGLNLLDETGYGIRDQEVERRPGAARVTLSLKATKDRRIIVNVKRGPDGTCVALPLAQVAGTTARLEQVYVFVAGFLRVGYVELRGVLPNGAPITERAKP